MNNIFANTKNVSASIVLSALFALPVQVTHAGSDGEALSFDRKQGNCIACHAMPTADPKKANLPGNIAPPLVAMKARFPNKADLRAQIYDATIKNPHSLMPPFGRHDALSSKQIDAITDYIYTL